MILRVFGVWSWCSFLLVAGCLGGSSPMDAGDDAPQCSANAECDDGVFCNGPEQCADGACVPGTTRCPGACDEENDRCADCADVDGDGFQDAACGGDDCDDTDPGRNPSRTEVCDVANRDEDCDPRTFGVRDADSDGEADQLCCNEDGGELRCGVDCDDTRPTVNTTTSEVCDGLDNDCDGSVDEGVLLTFHPDGDGDGFGDADGTPAMACEAPLGFVAAVGDCNDAVAGINPGVAERCDRPAAGVDPVDENCDGLANDDCACEDGETQPCTLPGLCASGVEICDAAGTWSLTCSVEPEPDVDCDGIDTDCDGATDEGLQVVCYVDDDNDGYPRPTSGAEPRCPVSGRTEVGGCPPGFTNRAPGSVAVDDCDDARSNVHPGAMEVCAEGTTNRDDDCDTRVDEGVATTCWVDADNDTYAPNVASMQRCIVGGRADVGGCPFGFTNRRPQAGIADCDDSIFAVNPVAMEVCDPAGVDENCDGVANPMTTCRCLAGDDRACSEGGLFGVCATGRQSCASGNWGPCSIPPVAESSCNGADDDCDGTTDEGFTVTCYADLDGDGYAPAGAATSQQCSCGAATRTTVRAPAGGDVDCDDGNAAVRPGAPEVCDRLDNDCSSGGGVEVAEDFDADGFSHSSASCTGGFPKSDCNDYDARVHPEQTAYFPVPRCARNRQLFACGGGDRCGSCSAVSLPPSSFDYDCDEEESPQERGVCILGGGFGSCFERGCSGSGPAATHDASMCGDSVSWRRCSCASGSCAGSTTGTSQLLGCR